MPNQQKSDKANCIYKNEDCPIFEVVIKGYEKEYENLKDFIRQLLAKEHQQDQDKWHKAGWEDGRRQFVDRIKIRLEYCKKQNGLPYCKNCGLNEEDLTNLTKTLIRI